jgi:hypothetical protein
MTDSNDRRLELLETALDEVVASLSHDKFQHFQGPKPWMPSRPKLARARELLAESKALRPTEGASTEQAP